MDEQIAVRFLLHDGHRGALVQFIVSRGQAVSAHQGRATGHGCKVTLPQPLTVYIFKNHTYFASLQFDGTLLMFVITKAVIRSLSNY